MGLTVTNVNTLSLLHILNRTTAEQSDTLTRLSTGKRINSGKDDPAGLIAVQSLSAELTAVNSAITNGQRANSVLGTADSALGEVSKLLSEIESLAAASTSSGGLSAAEISANQAQIDNAIDAINRIVQTTSFNGKRLLDGTQSIRATATAPSEVTDVRVFSRPSSNDSQTFAVEVVTAGAVASATLADTASISAAEFSIAGSLGTATITVSESDTLADVRDKIIAAASETGVSATVTGTELHIQSREFGSNSFVSASFISGDVDFTDVAHTEGDDAVVEVNGQRAFVDGVKANFNSNGTNGSFTLTTAGNVAGSAGNISITDGGLTFQLGTAANTQATVGVSSLFAHEMGDSATGYLSTLKSGGANALNNDANNAVLVAKSALSQVATQRGRVGGFQKFQVESSVNSLTATKEALTSARAVIQDADYAMETSELSRQSVLLQTAISLLGVAGQQTASILTLLR
ncbi:MAG TPA: flagellin [Phycisphaerae bacterium]|nr:flagellin [Phycisphaerae bacterium]